jgi:hypothetical protein
MAAKLALPWILQGLEFGAGGILLGARNALADGLCHMYVAMRGIPHDWSGDATLFTTPAATSGTGTESILPLSSEKVIDACVHRLPDGRWRMWYKDEAHQSHTYAADSTDFYHWKVVGPAITGFAHEGPNVFEWKGTYWMVVDSWKGLAVLKSSDAETWVRKKDILTAPAAASTTAPSASTLTFGPGPDELHLHFTAGRTRSIRRHRGGRA